MNFKDFNSWIKCRIWELNLSVDTTWSQQSRIQNINSVSCHNDFNCLWWFKTIKLIEKLKHSSLHLRVSSLSFHSWSSDGIYLINEYYARRMLSSHHEKLSNHSCSLSDVLLHQLRTRYSDECTVCMMSNSSSKQSFSCSWRSIHKNSLRLSNSQWFKNFWMLNGQLNNFLDFLNLLIKSSNHIVSRVRYFFHLHQWNKRIDFGWQYFVKNVIIRSDCNSQVGFNIFNFDGFVKINNILAFMTELNLIVNTLTRTLFLPITLTTSPT